MIKPGKQLEVDPAASERARLAAAREAAGLVESGMRVGLGTGRAAAAAIRVLGARIRAGELTITGIPTSTASRSLAVELGIPLLSDDFDRELDLTLDGADESDPELNVIKGAGGALVREKLMAMASRRLVLMAEEPKQSGRLGEKSCLPVAIIPFAWQRTAARLRPHCAAVELRTREGKPFVTDDHLYVLDLQTGPISDPAGFEQLLRREGGVVEVGLFVGLCDTLVIGRLDGTVATYHRAP